MKWLKWLCKYRFSYLDIAFCSLAYSFFIKGYYVASLMIFIIGIGIVKVFIESKIEQSGEDK